MPRTAEIIAVGSELLTGGVTNTNARFLSELLTAAGVDVLYHTAVWRPPSPPLRGGRSCWCSPAASAPPTTI